MKPNSQEVLLQSITTIKERSLRLAYQHLGPEDVSGIDYYSVFCADQPNYDALCNAAAELGEWVANKRGDVYRLDNVVDKPIVRISQPGDVALIGCADLIPVDYAFASTQLTNAGHTELTKEFNGAEYKIIGITDPEIGVAIYLPSQPLTRVMGIEA